MHCEIIDCYFSVFFVEIQLKKENVKSIFLGTKVWTPYWSPKRPGYVTGYMGCLKLTQTGICVLKFHMF